MYEAKEGHGISTVPEGLDPIDVVVVVVIVVVVVVVVIAVVVVVVVLVLNRLSFPTKTDECAVDVNTASLSSQYCSIVHCLYHEVINNFMPIHPDFFVLIILTRFVYVSQKQPICPPNIVSRT